MAAPAATPTGPDPVLTIGPPVVAEGVAIRRMAAESGVLDVNSRYAYVLWCRDFARTSVIARLDDEPVGFVTGYLRPAEPGVLFVWQVAVDAAARGRGLAGRMLDALVEQVPGVRAVETTVTPGNAASIALFTAFARRHETRIARSELFPGSILGADPLGADHEPEDLYRIGPLPTEG